MTTTYRITALVADDFKRIRHVEIRPAADAAIILIAGKNGQGKSSILDALTLALGGKRAQPADPVRHGADQAGITIELNNGELVIKRTIKPGGESSLDLRSPDGPIKSPQAMLDSLLAGRFLDPIAWLQSPAADQRETLIKLVDTDGQIPKLDAKHDQVFAARTEVGRDLGKANGELGRLAEVTVRAAIDVAALSTERAALTVKQRDADKLVLLHKDAARDVEAALRNVESAKARVDDLERQLTEARATLSGWIDQTKTFVATAETASRDVEAAVREWTGLQPRRDAIDAELARADTHNRDVFAAEAQNARRTAAIAEVAKLEAQRKEQTDMLDKIDRRKLGIMAAAKLPIENLGIDKTGITLNGVPFAQASGAERLRVALALAIAASPMLRDIWIRDGALLDDESLAIVSQHAEETGFRCWIERVSDKDAGAIIISDGMVVQ